MKKKYNYIFRLFLWIIVLLSFGGVNAQQPPEPDFAWAKRFGNNTATQRSITAPSLAVDE